MTDTADLFDMDAAPMRIGAVRLKVRDLDAVSGFYRRVLGLSPLTQGDGEITLGTGETSLLTLVGNPGLTPHDPRQAGLFHTAFLLPARPDLARWLSHAAATGVRLQGASDHIVSEALYLADPEGNGIEIYADRPVSRWRGPDGAIAMATERLDLDELLGAAGGMDWAGFPAGGIVGHVHLQVGDTATADSFYRDILGFDIAARYPGASFYGSGGYHHQLAGNVWNSRGAARRPEGAAGLAEVEIVLRDAADLAAIVARAESAGVDAVNDGGGITLPDPWGTAIRLTT